jgi:hypothetical protein
VKPRSICTMSICSGFPRPRFVLMSMNRLYSRLVAKGVRRSLDATATAVGHFMLGECGQQASHIPLMADRAEPRYGRHRSVSRSVRAERSGEMSGGRSAERQCDLQDFV